MPAKFKLALLAFLIAFVFGGPVLYLVVTLLAFLNSGFIESMPTRSLPFPYQIMVWYVTADWKAYLAELLMIVTIWAGLLIRDKSE